MCRAYARAKREPQARNLLRIIEILRNVDDFEIDVTVRKKTRAA